MTTLKYIIRANVALVAMVLLASCGAAVKMCKEPQLNMPETIVVGELDSLTIADVQWWEFYGDKVLKGFIEHAL